MDALDTNSPGVRWSCIAASGVLLGLSFPPYPFPLLGWLALVPLLWRWERATSGRRAFIDAYAALLVTFAIAFQWPLFHAFTETALLSLPGLLVIPMWMAVPFGLAHSFRRSLGRLGGLAALGCGIVLAEFALRRGPLAFPWTLLGHTQADLFPINQLAAIGGVPALTVFVFLINAAVLAIGVAWRHQPHGRGSARRLAGWLPAGGLLVALLLCGMIATRVVRSPAADSQAPFRVGIIQPAIPAESWANLTDSTRVTRIKRMSDALSGSVDLLLWPETTIPPSEEVRNRNSSWTANRDLMLLAGAIVPVDRREAHGASAYGARKGFYNAALYFRPGEPIRMYAKERLVPFAEHVPFQIRWPWLHKLAIPAGGVRAYLPGRENSVFQVSGRVAGVLICFETLFDDQARSYRRHGADLLVAITQDGWWGDSFGYRQHLSFTRLRAIETGLPVVQAAVSGISALIHPDGRILNRAGWMERAALVAEVPPPLPPTPYVRYGDWVPLVVLGISFALLILLVVVRKAPSSRTSET